MTILGITCQRDDGPFLAEWLAHHLAAGFDHMLVLSHDCSDGSDAHLEALSRDARITHLRFQPSGRKSVQWQALQLIADHPLYQSADWALFFDCDEFLVAPEGSMAKLLSGLAKKRGAFDAMALPWRLFGSGGMERRADGLTPERFTRSASPDLHFPLGHLFKSVHRPKVFQKPGVHRPRQKKNKSVRWLGPDGAPMPEAFAGNDKAITLYGRGGAAPLAWLNHYSLRSTEEFLVKRARGLPNHQTREISVTYWAERNWNTVENTEILPMLAATRRELDGLLAQPDVMATYEACLNWHRQCYLEVMQDIDTLRLEFRLNMLTGSTPPTGQAGARFLIQQMALLRNGARL